MRRHDGHHVVTSRRSFVIGVLASVLATGCGEPFEPFLEDDNLVFSMFGYLDLRADTQWVRVIPVRKSLLSNSDPLDAVVTLENLGSGEVITLRDSAFAFRDEELDATAYAHNFWTTERLESSATYRLKAVRSDGGSSTALIVMPPELVINFRNPPAPPQTLPDDIGNLYIETEHVVSVDVLLLVRTADCGGAGYEILEDRMDFPPLVVGPPLFGITAVTDSLESGCPLDLRRHEIRIVVAAEAWPYHPELSDLDVAIPNTSTSNVENGLGFVGGVATRTIPFHRCDVVRPRPGSGRAQTCEFVFNDESASLEGRVLRQPCGAPAVAANIRMVEEFEDGGIVVRRWRTGPEGEYRFEALEPGTRRYIELTPGVPLVQLPPILPGQRYSVQDLSITGGC